ncbi:hypothetical protein LTR36_003228 [Oleoguttula mirabilis]|uniref:BTB domain-containing protein n=1 Tax=Oleoguttula mirabilis TaxID=1507867 RepID=A0AAV9JX20_9PEZI|nr:hypothetical protein LTR36_003228 [Oleoguttula mirabilis]
MVTCTTHEWQVHRLVLTLHSPVLAKACDGAFKETAERKIDMSDDHPAAIETLVHYLYNLDYDAQLSTTCDSLSPMSLHVHVCVVADKYDIEPLKNLAINKFKLAAQAGIDTEDFAKAALQAYGTALATRPICDSIVMLAVERNLPFSAYVAGPGRSAFTTAMRQCADLAVDFAEAQYTHMERQHTMVRKGEKRYKCPSGNCSHSQIMEILQVYHDEAFACYFCEGSFTADQWRKQTDSA